MHSEIQDRLACAGSKPDCVQRLITLLQGLSDANLESLSVEYFRVSTHTPTKGMCCDLHLTLSDSACSRNFGMPQLTILRIMYCAGHSSSVDGLAAARCHGATRFSNCQPHHLSSHPIAWASRNLGGACSQGSLSSWHWCTRAKQVDEAYVLLLHHPLWCLLPSSIYMIILVPVYMDTIQTRLPLPFNHTARLLKQLWH